MIFDFELVAALKQLQVLQDSSVKIRVSTSLFILASEGKVRQEDGAGTSVLTTGAESGGLRSVSSSPSALGRPGSVVPGQRKVLTLFGLKEGVGQSDGVDPSHPGVLVELRVDVEEDGHVHLLVGVQTLLLEAETLRRERFWCHLMEGRS